MNIDTNNTMAPRVTSRGRAAENTQRRLQAVKEIAMKTPSVLDNASVDPTSRERVLRTALTALRQGNFVEVVDRFNNQFTFTDHALALEFKDMGRLREFLANLREHFPDSERKVNTKTTNSQPAIRDKTTNPEPVVRG